MTQGPPETITIAHDDYHASHVWRTKDGRQFFATNPFIPASHTDAGREFLALYLFDARGSLLEARIEDLGPRTSLDEDAARQALERRMAELGPVEFCRIQVRPFELERFGTVLG